MSKILRKYWYRIIKKNSQILQNDQRINIILLPLLITLIRFPIRRSKRNLIYIFIHIISNKIILNRSWLWVKILMSRTLIKRCRTIGRSWAVQYFLNTSIDNLLPNFIDLRILIEGGLTKKLWEPLGECEGWGGWASLQPTRLATAQLILQEIIWIIQDPGFQLGREVIVLSENRLCPRPGCRQEQAIRGTKQERCHHRLHHKY